MGNGSLSLRPLYKPTKDNPAMEWRYYTTGGGIVEKGFEFVTKRNCNNNSNSNNNNSNNNNNNNNT
jgi:hypothetical protein